MDPFGLTCDPHAYVARPACEAALAELERALRAGRVTALSGPPGIGKTLLLRVLERRLAGSLRCVYLPYGALELPELCRLALGLLAPAAAPGDDPEQAFVAALREEAARGRPTLLLLDDANAVPLPTLRRLVALVDSLAGALRLLAVPVDDERAARVLAALGRDVAHVRFADPMSAAETERYVNARLERAEFQDPARTRLDARAVAWLYHESAGIPRRLHQLVASLLHPDRVAPDTSTPFDTGPALELD